jgi:hypothetical protein
MRQRDVVFSSILTEVVNGDMLTLFGKALQERRFKSREQSFEDAPNPIRLFHRNHDVEEYNEMVFCTPSIIACFASNIV